MAALLWHLATGKGSGGQRVTWVCPGPDNPGPFCFERPFPFGHVPTTRKSNFHQLRLRLALACGRLTGLPCFARAVEADLVVLDTDSLTCPEDKVAATQAVRTYVVGKLVYQRQSPK